MESVIRDVKQDIKCKIGLEVDQVNVDMPEGHEKAGNKYELGVDKE